MIGHTYMIPATLFAHVLLKNSPWIKHQMTWYINHHNAIFSTIHIS